MNENVTKDLGYHQKTRLQPRSRNNHPNPRESSQVSGTQPSEKPAKDSSGGSNTKGTQSPEVDMDTVQISCEICAFFDVLTMPDFVYQL